MEYDSFITHKIDLYMGKPKSGKTLIAATYPKPMLYINVGDDGGGRVIYQMHRKEVDEGLIKVRNLKNDQPINGRIAETSFEKLAKILAELRQPGADKFKTIVIDTVTALQDDYVAYLSFLKGGKKLTQAEYGDVSTVMMSLKDNMKRFSEEMDVQFVWTCHTREYETYETSGLDKEIRIIPDLTVATGVKYLRDASNIFYCCRKTVINNKGEKNVKFLVFAGPHPVMDTGTRDMVLDKGQFIENFTYDKWQELIAQANGLPDISVAVPDIDKDEANDVTTKPQTIEITT